MCYSDEDRPPLGPVRGGADGSCHLTLVASDGVESSAFAAHPRLSSDRAVVILPDFRGLGPFYKDLAIRFADAGLHAVTIDYYTREIGRSPRPLDDEVGAVALRETRKDDVDLDVAAAVAWLRALPGVEVGPIFTVGFCFGGTMAWHQAASGLDLDGHVSFYGVERLLDRDRVPTMRGPIQMLISGRDREPVEVIERLAAEIRSSGEDVESRVYERATHGFFSRSAGFEAECDDAWARVLDFFERHSASREC